MTTANNNTTSTNFRLFVLFVLLVVSTGAFAQDNNTTTSVPATTATEVSVSEEKVAAEVITNDNTVASMDFAVWFTGVKKTSNNSTNGSFSKKNLINSGINTNSVLIRSFLKKINTQENGVA